MRYLKPFIDIVFSRTTLVCLAVLFAGLLIWFPGPRLGVEGVYPLAPAGVRFTVLALLLATAILWLMDGPLLIVALLACGLLVWYVGPQVSFGNTQALASVPARLLCVGLLVFIGLILCFCKVLKAVSEDPEFLHKLFSFSRPKDGSAVDRKRLDAMEAKAGAAVAQLKQLQSGGFWRRTFEKNRHLYALPWFLLVGGPGSGKTALLRQSGLQFPLARKSASGGALHDESGASDDCDWWLANEAVLLDTAGRFCAQPEGLSPAANASAATAGDAEWKGLLGVLRKHRPRAPVNGVLLTLSVAELLEPDAHVRARHCALLRERLSDVRQQLGIRCPVYLLITKADQLKGFKAYFQSLTSEGRTQVWGVTLPLAGGTPVHGAAHVEARREALRQELSRALAHLVDRIDAGQRIRFEEEFEAERRRALFALPMELSALAEPLLRAIEEIFLDSRFDDTQSRHGLRGVYFSSAVQAAPASGQAPRQADRSTVLQQLCTMAGVTEMAGASGAASPTGVQREGERQGYFLHALLTRIVIPEAGLVRPNLRWELRFRLLRLLGHGVALMVFVWLCAALTFSWRDNRAYLATVQARTVDLHGKVAALLAKPAQADAPGVLDSASQLARRPEAAAHGFTAPGFHYGLDTAPPVLAASVEVYARLQEITLLPAVLQRMESVLASSVQEADGPQVYATLRAYKLLHDPARYQAEAGAADVWAWVSADRGGPRGATATHLESLFSGGRAVQAGTPANEALVRQAQRFLDADTSGQRIYERAKAALAPEAPPDFTLVRAVGPQVGTVFARDGGLPLETGVPGLFTRDGYRKLFDKRLVAFVGRAADEDAWVMGRGAAEQALASESRGLLSGGAGGASSPLVEEVRRQYLEEYARRWTEFLDSIRAVGSSASVPGQAAASGTPLMAVVPPVPLVPVTPITPITPITPAIEVPLGFELSVLRQLAAPDSPLTRLARSVVAETTLAQAGAGRPGPDAAGLLDRLAGATETAASAAARPPESDTAHRQEQELVDKRFAALRELVTGQAGLPRDDPGTTGATRVGLESVMAAVNDFYTQLVVADTALGAGGLPPGGLDSGARLALAAGTLPAPLREILGSLARSGNETVALGAGGILRRQAQVQFDRLVGLMAQNVGEPCRRGIDGRYPFTPPASATQDAAIEDVTQVFAVGGAADEYFKRYLAPFVDTSVRPWRYRTTAVADTDGASPTPPTSVSGPTLGGELLKLLTRGGPDLDAFYRAQQIRDLFFDNGGRKLQWKLDLSVLELDPTITDLQIDIDGQGQRYMHGPVQALHVEWPGPRGGSMAAFTANPRISGATSTVSFSGAWALLHLLDKGRIVNSATPGKVSVELSFDGRKALLGIGSGSQPNPLNSDLLRGFHCPGSRAMTAAAATSA